MHANLGRDTIHDPQAGYHRYVGGPHPYVFGSDSPARVIIVPHVCTLEQKKNIATALWPVMLCHCLFL